jgi:leucyl aminopeptidase
VHFIVASCENMVDAAGLRPGDILVGAKGKTVEVNNTDAEGRLTLADALAYAQGDACPGVEVRTHRRPRRAGGRAGWPR